MARWVSQSLLALSILVGSHCIVFTESDSDPNGILSQLRNWIGWTLPIPNPTSGIPVLPPRTILQLEFRDELGALHRATNLMYYPVWSTATPVTATTNQYGRKDIALQNLGDFEFSLYGSDPTSPFLKFRLSIGSGTTLSELVPQILTSNGSQVTVRSILQDTWYSESSLSGFQILGQFDGTIYGFGKRIVYGLDETQVSGVILASQDGVNFSAFNLPSTIFGYSFPKGEADPVAFVPTNGVRNQAGRPLFLVKKQAQTETSYHAVVCDGVSILEVYPVQPSLPEQTSIDMGRIFQISNGNIFYFEGNSLGKTIAISDSSFRNPSLPISNFVSNISISPNSNSIEIFSHKGGVVKPSSLAGTHYDYVVDQITNATKAWNSNDPSFLPNSVDRFLPSQNHIYYLQVHSNGTTHSVQVSEVVGETLVGTSIESSVILGSFTAPFAIDSSFLPTAPMIEWGSNRAMVLEALQPTYGLGILYSTEGIWGVASLQDVMPSDPDFNRQKNLVGVGANAYLYMNRFVVNTPAEVGYIHSSNGRDWSVFRRINVHYY